MSNDLDLEKWSNIPVAVIVDANPAKTQIDPNIRPLLPIGRQPYLFGRAVTAKCYPPDFGSVLKATDLIKPGDVLVIAADGNSDTAMIGEIIAGVVKKNGGAGVVCDGAIRDVTEIAKWQDFPVFARHINPRGPSSWDKISVDIPVNFGGQMINPGDLIIGDDDGLVLVSPDHAEELYKWVAPKLELEKKWLSQLESGQSVSSVFDLP